MPKTTKFVNNLVYHNYFICCIMSKVFNNYLYKLMGEKLIDQINVM